MYALFYTDNADMVGTYDSLAELRAEIARLERQHRGIEDELGYQELDDTGRPAAEPLPATAALETV
jgi:hypothetical protein